MTNFTRDEMELFSPAIARTGGSPNSALHLRDKIRYIVQELTNDLVPIASSAELYLTVVIGLIALWFRMYIHFTGQYLFLRACSVSIYQFEVKVEEVAVKYISTAVSAAVEMGVVAVGPFAVWVVFSCFASFGALVMKVHSPHDHCNLQVMFAPS